MKRFIRLSIFVVMVIMSLQSAYAYDFYVTIQEETLDSYNLFFNKVEGTMDDLPLCEVTFSDCSYQGDEALYNNSNNDYKGIIAVPSTVEYEGQTYRVFKIGDHAFQNCQELTVIHLDYQYIIGKEAFKDCSLLEVCNPANYSVYEIHASAFENCKSLERFAFIPAIDAIPSIEEKVFAGCTGLKYFSLYLLGDILLSCPENVFSLNENNVIDCSLGVPCNMIEEYKSMTPWCWFTQITPIEEYPTGGGSGLSQIEETARNNKMNIIYTLNGVERRKNGTLAKGVYIYGNKKILLNNE